MTTMSPGATPSSGPSRNVKLRPSRDSALASSAVTVIACSSRGPRAGAAVSTWCHGTSWRMPCRAAAPPAAGPPRDG